MICSSILLQTILEQRGVRRMIFHNRQAELEALSERWDSSDAQLLLLYGRRRIGKTYLLQHFLGNDKYHCYFLAAQTSLAENMSQLAQSITGCTPDKGVDPADLPTLGSILRFIDQVARENRFALVLDEFQYLLEMDPSIASQIQAWWDTSGMRSKAFLVLCGSHLGIMEGLGGGQAPLFGRFTFRHKLLPMSYRDVAQFYAGTSYSVRDKLTAFGVLGGTPRYHALLDPRKRLESNLCSQILSPLGLLHNEPEILMASSQIRDPSPYNAALRAIASGCTRPAEIAQRVGASSAQLSFYLRNLMELEWVVREYPFDEKSERRAIYKIADPFMRFWYRFVAGLRSELEFQATEDIYRGRVAPYMNDYMGLHAFEDICHQFLRLEGSKRLAKPIRRSGRYWSRDGQLELDLIAELGDGHYLFGECKWSASPVGLGVYYDLRNKVAKLPETKYQDQPTYAVFSAAGFNDDLRATAGRASVLLISGDDLLG